MVIFAHISLGMGKEEASYVDWGQVGMRTWEIKWEKDGGGEYGKKWLKRGAFLGGLETWCKGNSWESCRMTPAKTPSHRAYLVWTGHLWWLGKSSSGGTGTSIQPHNIRPAVCPVYRMFWVRMAQRLWGGIQWLFQTLIYASRVSPPLTLPGVPGPRAWMAQRPRIDLNMTGEKIS